MSHFHPQILYPRSIFKPISCTAPMYLYTQLSTSLPSCPHALHWRAVHITTGLRASPNRTKTLSSQRALRTAILRHPQRIDQNERKSQNIPTKTHYSFVAVTRVPHIFMVVTADFRFLSYTSVNNDVVDTKTNHVHKIGPGITYVSGTSQRAHANKPSHVCDP